MESNRGGGPPREPSVFHSLREFNLKQKEGTKWRKLAITPHFCMCFLRISSILPPMNSDFSRFPIFITTTLRGRRGRRRLRKYHKRGFELQSLQIQSNTLGAVLGRSAQKQVLGVQRARLAGWESVSKMVALPRPRWLGWTSTPPISGRI